MVAAGEVVIGPGGGGRPRLTGLHTTAPLGVRMAAGEVHLLGTAGGPLGGDDLTLRVRVLAGTDVTVRSVAATVALPGDGSPSHQRLSVVVEQGARLMWLPEPLVAAAGCDHHVRADVDLAPDADLVWLDEVVLGRTGEQPGRLSTTLRVVRDGDPLVHHSLSTAVEGWDGPAVTAGAKVAAFTVHIGLPAADMPPRQGPTHTSTRLAPDVVLTTALADDHATVRRLLARG
jgi:urease accessory protein